MVDFPRICDTAVAICGSGIDIAITKLRILRVHCFRDLLATSKFKIRGKGFIRGRGQSIKILCL